MGWSGPGCLLFLCVFLLMVEAQLLLRFLPGVSHSQTLQVVTRLQSADLQIPVLVQQRGSTDDDEDAHSHHKGANHFHPLSVGDATGPHALRRCRDVAGDGHAHPHQHDHHTQQEPHTWGRSQAQFGLVGVTLFQEGVASWEAKG